MLDVIFFENKIKLRKKAQTRYKLVSKMKHLADKQDEI